MLDPAAAERLGGNLSGIPTYLDANLPTNLGAGPNQDEIIVGRFSEADPREGAMRTRALMEVLSGTLPVRIQVFNYLAFPPQRFPPAFSLINGPGLIARPGSDPRSVASTARHDGRKERQAPSLRVRIKAALAPRPIAMVAQLAL